MAAATQNQALNAQGFFYGNILDRSLGDIGNTVRAKRPARIPTVLTHSEETEIIVLLPEPHKLIALLMYITGLRAVEVCRLRINDIDFDTVRSGKGGRDGSGIRKAQTLFGHADVPGTQIYNHILGNAFAGVESPFG
ncbi:tyrosine-type recombinase/integrase [Pseudomonas marincola]|uniref:tyrosine-type recombinase/integrase n=1 Tax=Pseudomonas marincola TaxID=437900 RepID=UPI0008E50C3D|nr:tyrosine-type recombinase/integrase [Pseudomonas marincola]SFT85308.1 Phage integrase family protein [Pseudomonas marincola]